MENKNKYIVRNIQFSEPVQPKLTETIVKSNSIVLNGQNHKFVKFLIDLFQKSASHKTIIQTKSNMTAGHEIKIDIENGNIINEKEVKNFLNNVNDNGDTLQEVIADLSLDYHIFGYCFLQVIWTKGKSIYSIEHIDASTIACGKAKNGKIDNFYYSNDWSTYLTKPENAPVLLPAFNSENITTGKPQIIMIKKKEPGLVYYANPTYDQTTINYALQEFDLSAFLLNNTNQGFFPSAVITHLEPGMSDDQMDDIIESFDQLYTGTKQKKIIHVFPGDKDLKPIVDPFPTNDDYTKFIELNKTAQRMICIGHGIVNSQLACIPNEGGVFGDRNSIQDSFELLLKNNIRPVQILIEKAINKVLQYKFEGVKIQIQTQSPLQFKGFSENILSQVMTQTEIRNELGLSPLKEGDVTNLDSVRKSNPDLNNGQAVYPNSIIEQDAANNPNINPTIQ